MFFDFVSDLLIQAMQFVSGLESWQLIGGLALLGAVPFIESYLGSFIGTIVGAEPFLAVPAAIIGNLICTFAIIAVAGSIRSAATRNRSNSSGEQASGRYQKVQKYLDRFGVPGVCLLGPIVLASQITAPILVALGANKTRVFLWMGISITLWGIVFGFFGEAILMWFA